MDADELRIVKLFADLPQEELDVIAPLCNRTAVMPGTYLVKEGDFGYRFFGILTGSVVVAHGQTEVARLEAGEVFGEMALVEDERRNANVIAGETCVLSTMMSWDFRDAVASCPQFASAIDNLRAERSG